MVKNIFLLKNNNFINFGIVLKSRFNDIVLLDNKLGKIICFPKNKLKLINGSYISYSIDKNYNLSNINVIMIPNKDNIIFFHHVIEICYYFLPLDCNENLANIFKLFLKLYYSKQDKIFLRLLLYNLFKLLSLYPESIELDFNINLDNRLKFWLTACIINQPYYKYLKTVNFLKELDIYE